MRSWDWAFFEELLVSDQICALRKWDVVWCCVVCSLKVRKIYWLDIFLSDKRHGCEKRQKFWDCLHCPIVAAAIGSSASLSFHQSECNLAHRLGKDILVGLTVWHPQFSFPKVHLPNLTAWSEVYGTTRLSTLRLTLHDRFCEVLMLRSLAFSLM